MRIRATSRRPHEAGAERVVVPRRPAGLTESFTKVPKLGKSGLLRQLVGADIRVLLAICEHLPRPFPSVKTLADLCGCSVRATHNARKRLRRLGLISWSEPTRGLRSCRYTVNFGALDGQPVDESPFTPPAHDRPPAPRTTVHSGGEPDIIRSKASNEDKFNESKQRVRFDDLAGAATPTPGLPAATRSEIVAVCDALHSFGVKPHTAHRLVAGQPHLLAETVHHLVSVARQRRAKNFPGLLVQLIREEGARVTAEVLASRALTDKTPTPPHGATSDEIAPPTLAASHSQPTDDSAAARSLRENLAERDRCRAALNTTDDPEARARLITTLDELRATAVSLGVR